MNWKSVGMYSLIGLNTIAMASCFGLLYQEQKIACVSRWSESGMASRWKEGAGCLVEHKPGLWVQEKFLQDLRK